MEFSREQEAELLEKNMYKIYRAVDNYSARHSSSVGTVPYEDFVQVVSLEYIKYIRSCDTLEEVNVFPWRSAMGAMRDLILLHQPLGCPKTHTKKFSEIIHSLPLTVDLDDERLFPEDLRRAFSFDVDGMSRYWMRDSELRMDLAKFMETQPEYLNRMFELRRIGVTYEEIGEQFGITKSAAEKRIKKLYKNFLKFLGGARIYEQ